MSGFPIVVLVFWSRMGSILLRSGIVVCLCLALAGCNDKPNKPKPADPQGGDYYPAWSPDSRKIAYLSEDHDSTGIPDDWIRRIDLQTREIEDIWHVPRGAAIYDLAWSPDSRWLVFSSAVGIWKVHVTGDSLTLLAQGQFLRTPCWAAASGRIFYTGGIFSPTGLTSIAPDGTDLIQHLPASAGIDALWCFRESDSLIVSQYQPHGGECLLVAFPFTSTLRDSLRCQIDLLYQARISTDRGQVLFLGRPSTREEFSLYRLSRSGDTMDRIVDCQSFDLSPDDSTVVYAENGWPKSLRLINIYTKADCALTRVTENDECPKPREGP